MFLTAIAGLLILCHGPIPSLPLQCCVDGRSDLPRPELRFGTPLTHARAANALGLDLGQAGSYWLGFDLAWMHILHSFLLICRSGYPIRQAALTRADCRVRVLGPAETACCSVIVGAAAQAGVCAAVCKPWELAAGGQQNEPIAVINKHVCALAVPDRLASVGPSCALLRSLLTFHL